MNVKTTLLSMALLAGCILSVSAQSYYDDDIYYDASKDKEIKAAKAEAEAKKRAEEQRLRQQANFNPTLGGEDYAPADSYQYLVSDSSTRDVDEYNRRNRSSLDTDSTSGTYNDEFAYTRRIERFHNNDIIADYNDPDLTEYYYSSQQESPTEVNIYLGSPAWAWDSWYWPYRPWSWSYSWYSPWYWSSWDWYWGPTWSYYPGCYWHGGYYPWGPSYHPGWGPGYAPGHGHHHAWQPTPPTPSGRRPVGVRNGYTGLDQAGRRPASASSQSSSSSRNGYGNYRPASPSRVNNNASRPSGSSQNNYGTTTGRRSNSSSYNNNSYNSSRSRDSYNNSSRNSSSFSNGGRSAGTRSSGGFSGGNRGGGGARGGRR